jgi:hypothetical protein
VDVTMRESKTAHVTASLHSSSENRLRREPSSIYQPSQNQSYDAWCRHLWEALDDSDLESEASELFWQDPSAAISEVGVINYSLPRRLNSNSQTRQSCSSTSSATTCVADDFVNIECALARNTSHPLSSRAEAGRYKPKRRNPPIPEWESFTFSDQAPAPRMRLGISNRGLSQVDQSSANRLLTTGDEPIDGTVLGASVCNDGSWTPRPPHIQRQYPSFASDQTIYEQPSMGPTDKADLYPGEAVVLKPARRESGVWSMHLQI